MVIPARLLAWAERLDEATPHRLYPAGIHDKPVGVEAIIREMREAAGEDAREGLWTRCLMPFHALHPTEVCDKPLTEWPDRSWRCEDRHYNAPDSLRRESLGRLVREVWVVWAKDQDNPKPHHLMPWDELSDSDREVDRRIGETLAGIRDWRVGQRSPVEAPCEPALAPALTFEEARDAEAARLRTRSPAPAEPELWGVWCVRNGLPGFWRLSGDLQKRIEVPEAQARLVARLANDPHENTHARDGWRYEARPIPRTQPSPLPTEAGHYELTPSGEWRAVERSGR
jgi:hypothetical protein